MNNVFIDSFLAGITQTLIGHPFDTIKTIKQMNPNKYNTTILKETIKKNGILYLYRGYFPPLIGGCLQNSIVFTLENYFNKYIPNTLMCGFLSGVGSAIVMTPSEYIKCNLQINNKLKIKNIINDNLYKGIGLTLIRDSIGFSIYFTSYRYLQKKYNNPLINGGISGVLSWIYSYPIDTIKTKYQVTNKSIIQIIKNTSYKNYTSGMLVMLLRSFIVNAGIFYTFEKLQN